MTWSLHIRNHIFISNVVIMTHMLGPYSYGFQPTVQNLVHSEAIYFVCKSFISFKLLPSPVPFQWRGRGDEKTDSMVGSMSSLGPRTIKTDCNVYHSVLIFHTDSFVCHPQLPYFFPVFLHFHPDNFTICLRYGILMTVPSIFARGARHF